MLMKLVPASYVVADREDLMAREKVRMAGTAGRELLVHGGGLSL